MKTRFLIGLSLAGLLGVVASAPAAGEEDLADSLANARDLTVFAVAVKEADLVGVLRGKGPVTVFAPTDAAFDKLGDDKIRAIVKDKGLLKKLVLAHIVSGKLILSKDLAALDGKEFKVARSNNELTIGGARIVRPDLLCFNGVLHVTDTVLVPAE